MMHLLNHNASNCDAFFSLRAAIRLLSSGLCFLMLLLTGCSSTTPTPKPTHERGWIGGEYQEAYRPMGAKVWLNGEAVPNSFTNAPKHGLLLTALATNTPAHLAGLRAGDLILELNHQPVRWLSDFRRTLDKSKPGSDAVLKVYQNGQVAEHTISVGRETYEGQGIFAVGFPLYPVKSLDLWPNPSFSLIFLGYDQSRRKRPELGSADSIYRRHCDGAGKYEPTAESWRFWLAIFGVSRGTKTLSQEVVPATPSAADGSKISFAASR
jgi:hypothetical protein